VTAIEVDEFDVTEELRLPATAASGGDPEPRVPFRRRVRRRVIVSLVVVATVALVVLAFESPVARLWYESRQRQLASDFTVGRPAPVIGHAVALLQVPRLDINVVVVQGDGAAQLRGGPGHRPSTPLPGKPGNSVVLGHRHGWGAPFADLGELRPHKDLIVAEAHGGDRVVFTVVALRHVSGDDRHLFAPSTDHRLTLVTADGGTASRGLLVVVAVSGHVGTLQSARRVPPVETGESVILNPALAVAAVALCLAAWAIGYLRRRGYGLVAVVAVGVPLVAAGALALLLDADLLLPPLR
jgi:sortase A